MCEALLRSAMAMSLSSELSFLLERENVMGEFKTKLAENGVLSKFRTLSRRITNNLMSWTNHECCIAVDIEVIHEE